MRRSRSDRPSASSPPSTRRQRRRRSTCAVVASGMALDPQNLEQKRQRLLEAGAVDAGGGRQRLPMALADLRQQPAALRDPEAAEGAPQNRKELNEIVVARLAQPAVD